MSAPCMLARTCIESTEACDMLRLTTTPLSTHGMHALLRAKLHTSKHLSNLCNQAAAAMSVVQLYSRCELLQAGAQHTATSGGSH